MSNVSLLASAPTEIINALTATFSADHAALPPLADTATQSPTSSPSGETGTDHCVVRQPRHALAAEPAQIAQHLFIVLAEDGRRTR